MPTCPLRGIRRAARGGGCAERLCRGSARMGSLAAAHPRAQERDMTASTQIAWATGDGFVPDEMWTAYLATYQ